MEWKSRASIGIEGCEGRRLANYVGGCIDWRTELEHDRSASVGASNASWKICRRDFADRHSGGRRVDRVTRLPLVEN